MTLRTEYIYGQKVEMRASYRKNRVAHSFRFIGVPLYEDSWRQIEELPPGGPESTMWERIKLAVARVMEEGIAA